MYDYKVAKEAFVDEIRVDDYIDIRSSKKAYNKLLEGLERPFKMILLYGQPGTGKTMMLNHIYINHRHQKDLHLIDTPLLTQNDLYSRLFHIFTGTKLPPNTKVNFDTLVEYGRRIKGKREIAIMIDEAQMYPQNVLEEIRIMSDTGSLKFVIALHKTEDEELIAKEHFKTRIWESIELKNATLEETKVYVYKKLLNRGLIDIANQFTPKHHKLIYKFTKGNFRDCSKLMYGLFEICEYYDEFEPSKIDSEHLPIKILEMAALRTGLIDA